MTFQTPPPSAAPQSYATPEPPRERPNLRIGETIGKKIGPLPLWGWGVAIGGGYLAYKLVKGGGSQAPAFLNTAGTGTGTGDQAPSSGMPDLQGLLDSLSNLISKLPIVGGTGGTGGAGGAGGSGAGGGAGGSGAGGSAGGSGGTNKVILPPDTVVPNDTGSPPPGDTGGVLIDNPVVQTPLNTFVPSFVGKSLGIGEPPITAHPLIPSSTRATPVNTFVPTFVGKSLGVGEAPITAHPLMHVSAPALPAGPTASTVKVQTGIFAGKNVPI